MVVPASPAAPVVVKVGATDPVPLAVAMVVATDHVAAVLAAVSDAAPLAESALTAGADHLAIPIQYP